MLSRREMGALCASLLFCLLLSLGAGWAQSQLITADQLSADTLRLHIRADTDSVRDQSAKLAVRDAVLALTDEACPADSRADARAWVAENLVLFELTARQTLAALGIRAPVKACLVNMYFPTRRYDGGALPACSATRFLRNRDRIVEKKSPILRSISEARSLASTAPQQGERPTQEGGLF